MKSGPGFGFSAAALVDPVESVAVADVTNPRDATRSSSVIGVLRETVSRKGISASEEERQNTEIQKGRLEQRGSVALRITN